MSETNGDSAIELELRFFATFRSVVGQKEIEREFDGEATVGDVLSAIEAEFPDFAGDILTSENEIEPHLTVLKNGREAIHLDGTETELADGDRVSVFPPVAGGGLDTTRSYRGISKRLAANYLENLGGERVDVDGDRIEGDGWTADLSAEAVSPSGSIELTEVTVDFEGNDEVLADLIEDFSRKAIRAGG